MNGGVVTKFVDYVSQYAPAFAANDIDGEVLREVTADDLIGLGVTSIGHRRKLLAAITALRSKGRRPSRRSRPWRPPLPARPSAVS